MSVQVAWRRYHRGSSFLRRSSGASGASGGAKGGNGARGACAPKGGSGPCGGIGLCSSGPAFSCEWCAYALRILARSSSARMAASTMGANRMCCRGSKARYGSHGGGGYAGSDGGGRGGSLRSSWNNEVIGKQTERIHSMERSNRKSNWIIHKNRGEGLTLGSSGTPFRRGDLVRTRSISRSRCFLRSRSSRSLRSRSSLSRRALSRSSWSLRASAAATGPGARSRHASCSSGGAWCTPCSDDDIARSRPYADRPNAVGAPGNAPAPYRANGDTPEDFID